MKFRHDFTLSEAGASHRIYRADGVSMRIDFFDHVLRTALIRDGRDLLPTWSVCPDGNCPLEGRDKLSTEGFALEAPEVEEDEEPLTVARIGSTDDDDIFIDDTPDEYDDDDDDEEFDDDEVDEEDETEDEEDDNEDE